MAFAPVSDFAGVGNVGSDVELKFTPSGAAVAKFRAAFTPRVKDGDGWKDGTPLWATVTVWRKLAENVAESIVKGHRVVVLGTIGQREWETPEGEKRTALEIQCHTLAPDLTFATAKVTKNERNGNGGSSKPAAGGSSFDDEPPW
jgi:single-strand DNA-binding protein